MLGRGHISHIVNNVIFYSINIQFAIVLRDFNWLSYTMVDFHLFYDGAVDIQI